MRYLGMRLFFLTIPKTLKQYTLFKKDYPFRSPLRAGSGGVDSPNRRLIINVFNENSRLFNYMKLSDEFEL